MPKSKPIVQVACICEKVLIEPDNVASLIRIVDTYMLRVPPNEPLPKGVGVELTAFVSLKSGDVVGEFQVGLQLKDPDGNETPLGKWPIVLNGDEHGANLRIDFSLANPKIGLYWFVLLWREEELTSIPFRLKYAPLAAETGPPSESETH
jgi:hypothetical protein